MASSPSSSSRVGVDPAFQIYQDLREYEARFNATQAEVKKLASAWMLAAFAALAFIVRGELVTDKSLIDSAPLIAVIALAANIGLLTLWVIDQRIYQGLLSAVFEVGLEMEQRHPEWPPIRSLMWVNSRSRGMARYHALFYAAPMAFDIAAAAYAVSSMTGGGNAVVVACVVISVVPLLIVLGDWFSLGLERKLRERSEAIEQVAARWRR